jgi:hypothetical protein
MLFKTPSGSSQVGIVQAPQVPNPTNVPLLDQRALILLAIMFAVVAAFAIRS